MLLAAILLAAATGAEPQPVVIDKVVAIVDDQIYFRSDLIAEAHRAQAAGGAKLPTGEALAAVLEQFVSTAMIIVDAKREKIDATNSEIDQALRGAADERKTTVDKLYAEQEAAGVSKTLVREAVRRQLVVQRWIVTKVLPRLPRGLSSSDKDAYQKAYGEELKKVLAEIRPTMFVEIKP